MNFKRKLKEIVGYFNKLIFIKRKKDLEPHRIKSILVVSLYFRGDFLFHSSFLKLLSNFLPNAKIDVWIKSRNRELTSNNPHINEVLVFDNIKTADYNDSVKLDLIGKFSFLRQIRKKRYDLVVDLTGKVSTALITYFSKASYTIGINNYGFGAAYDSFVDIKSHNTSGHLINKYIDVIKYGFKIDDIEWNKLTNGFVLKPYIYPSDDDKQIVDDILNNLQIEKAEKLFVIHTTAGWKAKEWDASNYSRLLDKIHTKGYKFVFVGDDQDKINFKFIIENSALKDDPKFKDHFLKLKFLQLAELIKRSDVFIGSDSAPLHIAGAMETPSVGLFGPTNPDFSNPIGERHKVVYYELFCSASNSMQYCTRNAGRTCPSIDCMKMIKADVVFKEIENLIDGQKN